MLPILLTFLYITFTLVNFGVFTERLLGVNTDDFFVRTALGLFTITMIAGSWALFGRINWEFHVFLLGTNVVLTVTFRHQVLLAYRLLLERFRQLNATLRVYLFVSGILIVAQCATRPYILDNESYYIQTIKWLNEYGFVKGLGNLHLFFAQSSGWHVAQSVFNFSFLYGKFNDLSGYMLLLANGFAVFRMAEYFLHRRKTDLIIGLFPIANVLLFQFINTPSPDIPSYILALISAYYFLTHFKNCEAQHIIILSVFVLFALYIKPTNISLGLMPLIMLVANIRQFHRTIVRLSALGLLTLVLFAAKNSIVSGYPLFPYVGFAIATDWVMPQQIVQFYYDQTRAFAFGISVEELANLNYFEQFKIWIGMSKLHGAFNILGLLLLAVSGIVVRYWFNQKQYWLLYLVMVLQMLLLFLSSPQYRFFLNFILLFVPMVISVVAYRPKIVSALLYFSLVPLCFFLFFNTDRGGFTNNPLHSVTKPITMAMIVEPHSNSKFELNFVPIKVGNLRYYSPAEIPFFYGTGAGPLPCVNRQQLLYFAKELNYYPQLRTGNLADGFYAQSHP